jgi:hypothetical protein
MDGNGLGRDGAHDSFHHDRPAAQQAQFIGNIGGQNRAVGPGIAAVIGKVSRSGRVMAGDFGAPRGGDSLNALAMIGAKASE